MMQINQIYKNATLISKEEMSELEQAQTIRKIEEFLERHNILLDWEVKK